MASDPNDDVGQLLRLHRSSLQHPLPADLRARVAALGRPETRSFAPWASMAAACCVVAILSFQWGQLSVRSRGAAEEAQEVVSGHIRSLMANHLSDVVSTDQHTVKPWFEGKLDFGPDVRDFAAQDFPLVGGRLDYLGNRSVAALAFKHGKHLINLFEWPSTSPGPVAPKLSVQRGYQLFTWQQNGLEFWLVSDLNAADMKKLADLYFVKLSDAKPEPPTSTGK